MLKLLQRLCLALVMGGALSSHAADAVPGRVPNLLIILTDDQGYGDLSLHGNTVVDTPFIDRLASESVQLEQFHAGPVCAPTRASLMTGKQFLRAGVWGVHGGRDYLDLSETTLAERLKRAGYRTAMAGKWHLGKTDAYLPWNRGFEQSWSITDRLYMHTDPVIDHNGAERRPRGWTVDYLTDRLLAWIGDGDERPFFAYLAHPYIHEPYYAPERLIEKYRSKGLSESFARLCAMTEHLDEAVGRLVDELDRMGLREDTIVFFLGDNGPIGNPGNLPHLTSAEMALRNPAGLRGLKGNLYENGTRAPCFVRWPDHFPARLVNQECDITDLVPTVLDLAGVSAAGADLDGHSLAPLLRGDVGELASPTRFYANHELIWPGRERLYDFFPGKHSLSFDDQVLAVREGDFKYILQWGQAELYNIVEDPRELANLVAIKPDLAVRLRNRLQDWWEHTVLPSPTTYAMPTFPLPERVGRSIVLHPCAAVAIHGGIVPNSHTADHWVRNGDGITYAIDNPRAGTFAIGARMHGIHGAAELVVQNACGNSVVSNVAEGRIELGSLCLPAGPQRLDVHLKGAAGEAIKVTVLQAITLRRL